MNKKLLLKDLENLKEPLQDKLLSDFVQNVDFELSVENLSQLEQAISSFERAHGISSERMLIRCDCEALLVNPELGHWAALYCSYKELKESAYLPTESKDY